jgi:thiol-disulfide isomerase/thioredoxin
MTEGDPTPRKAWKVLLPVALIVAVAASALVLMRTREPSEAPARESEETAELEVGSRLPDFELSRFGGGQTTLSKAGGKLTLINVWASWCPPCLVEMPSIVKLRQKYRDRGFEVVAITMDEKPDRDVPPMLRKLKIDFPVYTDLDGKIAELFGIDSIPLTIIVDANRNVLLVDTGERDWNDPKLHEQIERWLVAAG